ncbi:MAG: 50S ribosomal protein L11 methyltransferase [Chloroflexota bacterium]
MRWLELRLEVASEDVDTIAELFHRFGCGGVAIEENVTIPPEGDSYSVHKDKPVVVKTYLPLDETIHQKKEKIAEGLRYLCMIHPFGPLEERELAEEDWANAWKEHFDIHRVGHRLVIRPPWKEYAPTAEDVVIKVDPGMAFGTGLHPSTRLCLVAIERWLQPGMSVLDLGTGSGILAIAAAKLGASSVLALDTDLVAVEAAKANTEANGLKKAIAIGHGTLTPEQAPGPFNLIAANIIARVIIDLAEPMVRRLLPGGILISGGIIADRLSEVLDRFESLGTNLKDSSAEGDWRTVVIQAPP